MTTAITVARYDEMSSGDIGLAREQLFGIPALATGDGSELVVVGTVSSTDADGIYLAHSTEPDPAILSPGNPNAVAPGTKVYFDFTTTEAFGSFDIAYMSGTQLVALYSQKDFTSFSMKPIHYSGTFDMPDSDVTITVIGMDAALGAVTYTLDLKTLTGLQSATGSIREFEMAANASFSGSTAGGVIDVARFHGRLADYAISKSGDTITVTDRVAGRDGTGTLSDFERLRFNDVTKAYDILGDAGQGYRLYQAAFNRTPDTDGVSFWVNKLDRGTSLQDVAQAFVTSSEYQTIYGTSPDVRNVVSGFYSNVLGRSPDAPGLAYWVGVAQSGMNVADLLINFSESGENQLQTSGAVANGINLSSALLV